MLKIYKVMKHKKHLSENIQAPLSPNGESTPNFASPDHQKPRVKQMKPKSSFFVQNTVSPQTLQKKKSLKKEQELKLMIQQQMTRSPQAPQTFKLQFAPPASFLPEVSVASQNVRISELLQKNHHQYFAKPKKFQAMRSPQSHLQNYPLHNMLKYQMNKRKSGVEVIYPQFENMVREKQIYSN